MMMEAGQILVNKGIAGDCVVRSIAIATQIDYQGVYNVLFQYMKEDNSKKRKRKEKSVSPRNGIKTATIRRYLADLGWKWIPLMKIGSGCTVHMKAEELPKGRIIVSLSKHISCVIDGIIHDTYDCSRDETRCVYGYWKI